MPFGAMWYTVPPGRPERACDCHPEQELSHRGHRHRLRRGRLPRSTEVTAGTAFLLDSEEAHVIHNRERGAR